MAQDQTKVDCVHWQGYPFSRNPTKFKENPHVFDFCGNRRERKIFIRVFGHRGKEKCKKDNNKNLFYNFILIDYKSIFNYENINVISQNI